VVVPHEPLPLAEEELLLQEQAEVLRRQVHPTFFHNGEITSQAFRPTPSDGGQLSVRRESLSAESAFKDHCETYGLESAGTWGISVGEVREAGARAIDDSAKPDTPKAHAYIDFRSLSPSDIKKVSRILKSRAHHRGRLYPPGDSQDFGTSV
jgi:hypothetical protein